ncbi:hypothetical protein MANES_04G154202v8 [Manihot esculenta]|uniref:Uncharacterized protein n=1 Tax=Manihot esculenta TaxID=3983 RepID=A0ACB7I0I9_MANES|nr:hypothetical protein MANES_04G154202v8 [Manihot esculenta]
MPNTGSISLMDHCSAFSATLHLIMTERKDLDFALLDPCLLDCLVHLASSLLHPENILANPSGSQIEQLLHSTSSSPMFSRLPMSYLAARTFDTESGFVLPHSWRRRLLNIVVISSSPPSALLSDAIITSTCVVSSSEATVAGLEPPATP